MHHIQSQSSIPASSPASTPLETLRLPLRVFNALHRTGVESVEQLIALTDADLLKIPNLGTKALHDLKATLNERLPDYLLEEAQARLASSDDVVKSVTKQWELNIPLWDLNLPIRVKQRLLKGGVHTLGLLLLHNRDSLSVLLGSSEEAVLKEVEFLCRQWAAQQHGILLEQLDLPLRTLRILQRANIMTVEELLALDEHNLLGIPHLGNKAIQDIITCLNHVLSQPFEEGHKGPTDLSQEFPGSSTGIPNLNTPIWELELSPRLRRCLFFAGVFRFEVLLDYDYKKLCELLQTNNFGEEALTELRRACLPWLGQQQRAAESAQKDIQRVKLAHEHGIALDPDTRTWLDLLDAGHDWLDIAAFDVALRNAALPTLVSLPATTFIEPETVRYLLRIGCPLSRIPVHRMTLNATYRQMRSILLPMKVTNALQMCLADRQELPSTSACFADFEADCGFYIEWLGAQSDWSQEVANVQPSPVALFHLTYARPNDLVGRLLANLSERQRDVLMLRYGVGREREQTLQEVADAFGFTRERARQIITKALAMARDVHESDELLQAFIAFCNTVIEQVGFIDSQSLASEVTEQLNMYDENSVQIIPFILEVTNGAYYSDYLNAWVAQHTDMPSVMTTIKAVERLLGQTGAPIRFADIAKHVQQSATVDLELAGNHKLLRRSLEVAPEIVSVEDDYWGLRSWERRITDDMVMILRKLQRPAHFTEIADLVNQRVSLDQQTNPRAAHAQLANHTELFARTGPGTFQLREGDPDMPAQPVKYIDLIEQVLTEAERPLDIDEIFNRVHARREAKRSSITMYLTMNDRFAQFGNNAYGLALWDRLANRQEGETQLRAKSAPEVPPDFLEHLKATIFTAFDSDTSRTD